LTRNSCKIQKNNWNIQKNYDERKKPSEACFSFGFSMTGFAFATVEGRKLLPEKQTPYICPLLKDKQKSARFGVADFCFFYGKYSFFK